MPEAAARLSPDARREHILGCALPLFGARGFDAVSMSDIAREAGVARGLLNHYFGAKADLEAEAVRAMLRVRPVLPGEAGDDLTWDEAIDRWLDLVERHGDAFFAALDVGRPDLRAIVDEARELAGANALTVLGHDADAPRSRAAVRAFSAFAEQATREWLRAGRLSRDDVRALMRTALPQLLETVKDQEDPQ